MAVQLVLLIELSGVQKQVTYTFRIKLTYTYSNILIKFTPDRLRFMVFWKYNKTHPV